MTKSILLDSERIKTDQSDDSIFYSSPRFVHHLDDNFRNRLTSLYTSNINHNSVVLDLMSSWVSHLPNKITYSRVIGHGMNLEELKSNKSLDSYWVQNLNNNQILPLDDRSIDVGLIVAGWQYLQYPEKVAQELRRVIKVNGKLIISFSNRAFWNKAPMIWSQNDYKGHISYIKNILSSSYFNDYQVIIENNNVKKLFGILETPADPFYSIIAK